MSLKRWLPTFLGFPLGGLIAINTVGSVTGPLSGAAAGVVAGAAIGAAQWLALRTDTRWIAYTAAATGAGGALAAALGAGPIVTGLITGATVGAAQSALLESRSRPAWIATSSAAWALGWFVTSNVIVDLERGYAVFGSSGAVLATLLTGLVLRLQIAR
ncbi:hypothetical protein OJ997_09125 [Solirubrobacter phytolaccae]|uniref:Uncharacterized protein n=1 Tax=Solirubrobacter phytolaccae TaxID=1404360 RepID=A0A9X3S7L7_9ACTN|nr:hypothetical protein [Solirubrobacter phytolaccae]MDA0180453.1 hypothetical protein [Solirubrobacter phytolaccae]